MQKMSEGQQENLKFVEKSNDALESIWENYQTRLSANEKYLKETVEIKPIPSFTFRTLIRLPKEKEFKLCFVNVCSCFRIPEPRVEKIPKEQQVDGITERLRVPCSCGRQEFAEKGEKQTIFYDVVFHPDVIEKCSSDTSHKEFICSIGVQNIMKKEKVVFNLEKIEFVDKYVGNEKPKPQRVRKARNLVQDAFKPSPMPEAHSTPVRKDGMTSVRTKRRVNVVCKVILKNETCVPYEPTISALSIDTFQVDISLPLCETVENVDLEIRENTLVVSESDWGYNCEHEFPLEVSDQARAQFFKSDRILRIHVKPSKKSFEEWRKLLNLNEKALFKLF